MTSFTQYFTDGGNFMWPILGIFFIGLGFVVERLLFLWNGFRFDEKFASKVAEDVSSNGIEAGIQSCSEGMGPVPNLCLSALERSNHGTEEAEKSLDNSGMIEMASMEKNMTWISFCITTAPMLGFLGTVVGMIAAFNDIKVANDISPAVVAGGISIALLTTAFGLIVAVILQLLQNLCLYFIDIQIVSMQKSSILILDSIKEKLRNNS